MLVRSARADVPRPGTGAPRNIPTSGAPSPEIFFKNPLKFPRPPPMPSVFAYDLPVRRAVPIVNAAVADWPVKLAVETQSSRAVTTLTPAPKIAAAAAGALPDAAPALAFTRRWLDTGYATLAADGCVLHVNRALADWLERAPEALAGQSFWPLLAARFPACASALDELVANPAPFAQLQLSPAAPAAAHPGASPAPSASAAGWLQLELARHPGGASVRLHSMLPPARALADAPWDEHLRNETARREMFMRLLRAETRLENLTQRWPGVIFNQRADFTFQFVSPKIEELTGIPAAEWGRRMQPFWQVIHEADAHDLQQQCRRAAQTGERVTSTFRLRHAQTGHVAYVLEHRQALRSDSGLLLGYEGVWLDVTRQTIAEQRLSAAAWKETLGVITLGLAHDFSNIMAGIQSLSDSFLADLSREHPFHEGIGLINGNAKQATQLVRRIISLHHGKVGEWNYHDLNEITTDAVDLVRKTLPRRVEIRTELAAAQVPIYADAVEFRQVLINLALNASHAMPGGGTLTFLTSQHDTLPPLTHIQGIRPRLPAVCLTVADTGCGIKESHLEAIFNPFFTTKALNKGAGLGLYNARLFVEKHRGMISVESVENAGTCFRVWLPLPDFSETETAETTAASGPAGASAPAARKQILLAGPAGKPRADTAERLRVAGYFVAEADSPADARALLAAARPPFDGLLIVTDRYHPAFCELPGEVRAGAAPVKTVLQVLGSSPDEVDPRWREHTDLLIPPDLAEAEILTRLSELLRNSS